MHRLRASYEGSQASRLAELDDLVQMLFELYLDVYANELRRRLRYCFLWQIIRQALGVK